MPRDRAVGIKLVPHLNLLLKRILIVMTRRLAVLVCLLALILPVFAALRAGADERLQLRNLGEASQPRFEITDRVWPDPSDPPHVCLWKDDKLAAVSITIDDNTAPDHDWWVEHAERYGFKVTWFVITGLISDRPTYHGTWAGFARLRELGHDVQSHTVTHLNFSRGFDPDDPDKDIAHEYAGSIAAIEEHLPGGRVVTLAYPGGKNTHYNDDAEAAGHFIAARGTRGTINPVNQTNYLRTHSIGGGPVLPGGRAKWAYVTNLFDPEAYRPNLYRGWYVTHYHQVKDDMEPRMIEKFEFLKAHDDDLWVALFREAAMYGQQRDTARLTVEPTADETIRFSVSDDMDDELFDFPLTIKVRLPDAWPGAVATQGGVETAADIVEHQGVRFALVQAVPDRGVVELTKR